MVSRAPQRFFRPVTYHVGKRTFTQQHGQLSLVEFQERAKKLAEYYSRRTAWSEIYRSCSEPGYVVGERSRYRSDYNELVFAVAKKISQSSPLQHEMQHVAAWKLTEGAHEVAVPYGKLADIFGELSHHGPLSKFLQTLEVAQCSEGLVQDFLRTFGDCFESQYSSSKEKARTMSLD